MITIIKKMFCRIKDIMKAKTILLFFVCTLLFAAGCVTNPITGKEELVLLSEQEDIALGEKYAPEIEKQLSGKVDNATLQEYIDKVGQKVAHVSQRPGYNYHFAALNDKSINAFTLPGGHIYITKGLLVKLKSESELAAVLAHETAHAVARDNAKAMSRQIGIELLLSTLTSDKTADSAKTIAKLTGQIIDLRYSRADEKTADLAGIDYMAAAGYNPNGMLETMEMLQKENESRSIEFLSSHPNPENRTQYIRKKILTKFSAPEKLQTGEADYKLSVLEKLK